MHIFIKPIYALHECAQYQARDRQREELADGQCIQFPQKIGGGTNGLQILTINCAINR